MTFLDDAGRTPEVLVDLGERYYLRKARLVDAMTVLQDVRKEDREEWSASMVGGLDNLKHSIMGAYECYTVADKFRDIGNAHIIFGMSPNDLIMTHWSTSWLLGTNEGQQIAWWVFHKCREFTAGLFERHPYSECRSDVRQPEHHKWLEWVGYKLNRTVPYGPQGQRFKHYRKEP